MAFSSLASLINMMPVYLDVLTNPYIHQKAEEFYAKKMEQKEIAVPLPADNPSAVLIRALCARNPGRYLMIDFWGMSCGPCRAAIQMSKELRAEIAKRDDVKLIFIAEERTAEGSDEYKKYVSEWLADEETICMAKADFVRLQELFQFNGIPHYETITPDCRRVRDDLRINGYSNFDEELERLKEKLVAVTGQAQTILQDWFKTDTIIVKGQIEGYNAEQFGFTTMLCYLDDVMEKDNKTLVMEINPDGTFEKNFPISYPMHLTFVASGESKVGFSGIPFFKRV